MAPKPSKAAVPPAHKRQRKRKRRNVSSSSSSSSDSSSTSENEAQTAIAVKVQKPTAKTPSEPASSDHASSSESSSSEDSDADSDVVAPNVPAKASSVSGGPARAASQSPFQTHEQKTNARAESPPPLRNVAPPNLFAGGPEKEKILKERFRKFWLAGVADAFADDLNEIRKEPNLTPSRLALLIDSLGAGANVYAASSREDGEGTNDMEVVLGD